MLKRSEPTKHICKKCGIEFAAENSRKRMYCSIKCRNSGNRLGKKHSEETKRKIRKARKRQVITEETKRKMSEGHSNRVYTKEWRNNISRALKGKKHKPNQGFQKGSENPNWGGGVSPELVLQRKSQDNRIWRESVYARDDFTCQKCGDDTGGNLNAHHIQNFIDYPELRFAVSNGITLCEKCHIKFHKKFGYKENDEGQLFIFIGKDD